MTGRKLFFAILFCGLVSPRLLHSQDSLTAKDAGEINYRAELLVNELKDLLNTISNSQIGINETKELIVNSFSNSKNKIFYDSAALIEDDLNPLIRNSDGSKDLRIASYLNNLDLFYEKSDMPSIDFDNIKVSNIKRGEYLYVKVYYSSMFKGKNTLHDSLFGRNYRVAEIRVERKDRKWIGAIVHIGFYPANDIAIDTINDVKLSYLAPDTITGGSFFMDTLEKSAGGKSFEEILKEREKQKQREAFNEEQKVYEQLLKRGDELFESGDYTAALKVFSDAKELRPYETDPKLKMAQVRKKVDQSAVSANELFNQYISKARVAESARKYELAKEHYMSAFTQKPEEAQKFTEHIRELNDKIRTLSELGEKFISGLYKEAIKDYDAAIKKNNSNSDYYLGRAKCYDKLNEYSKALKDYSRSIDLDNNNLEALQLRADLYKRNFEHYKALADYKLYLTVDKSNIEVYTEMSGLHVLTNNVKAAVEDLDNALRVNPKMSGLYHKKGLLLLRQDDMINSAENFSTAIQLDSNATLSYYYRGECKLFTGKIELAAIDFEMARTKRLDSTLIRNIEVYAEAFDQRAQNNFQVSNLDSAVTLISYAILINPAMARYRFSRGEFHYFLQHYDEAIRNYDKAISLDARYKQAFYKRGIAYYNIVKLQEAIADFNAVVALDAMDAMSFKGLGDSYFRLADYTHAITNLESCLGILNSKKIKQEPVFLSGIFNQLGKSYSNTGDFEKAIANFKSAIKINKIFPEAYFNRGYAYYKSSALSTAIDDLSQALAYESHLLWNYTLACVYRDKEDYINAVVYFNNTINLDSLSELRNAYYERGHCNYQLQNYQVALPDYFKCAEWEIDSISAMFNTEAGNICLHTAKYDSSFLFFNKSLVKDPNDMYAIYGIASMFYLQNKLDESLAWFERLFRLKTFNPNAVKKDKLIAGIRDNKKYKALVKKYY